MSLTSKKPKLVNAKVFACRDLNDLGTIPMIRPDHNNQEKPVMFNLMRFSAVWSLIR